jgi:hypothetical protein
VVKRLHLVNTSVRVRTDSVSAAEHLNFACVNPNHLARMREFVDFLFQKGISISAEWIPRSQLTEVDAASRVETPCAWGHAQFRRALVLRALRAAGLPPEPDFDLFATGWNTHAPTFCSRAPEPGSVGEAFAWDWGLLLRARRAVWAFPPMPLARLALVKWKQEAPGAPLVMLVPASVAAPLLKGQACPVSRKTWRTCLLKPPELQVAVAPAVPVVLVSLRGWSSLLPL